MFVVFHQHGHHLLPFALLSREIQFSMLSADEIARLSEVEIFNRLMYDSPNRVPMRFGVLDPRLVRSYVEITRFPKFPIREAGDAVVIVHLIVTR